MAPRLPAERRDVWTAVAAGTYQARSSKWDQRMGHGPIYLEEAGIRWLQTRWRWVRWFHPFVKWAPDEVLIPFELIEDARTTGGWYAPILHLDVRDASFQFRVGRGYFTRGAPQACRGWADEILRRRDRLRGDANA